MSTPADLQNLINALATVEYSQFPKSLQDFLKRDILDSLGASISGSSRALSRRLTAALGGQSAARSATLLGSWGRVPVRDAALINGTCAHAWELDDQYEGGGAPLHAGGVIVTSALAMAEACGHSLSGRAFMEAVGAGLELECRLARATSGGLGGWHLTSVYGYFGAAMACSRILRLSPDQVLHALGIAFAQAAGNLAATADAADTKALQAGLASSGGALSALLAAGGITGPRNSFDGPTGIFALYHKGIYDPSRLYEGVLETWVSESIGFKPWPSCRYTQGYLTALMDLKVAHGVTAENVAELRLDSVFAKFIEPRDVKVSPRNVVDAQFSLPYTLACMLQTGTLSIADLQEERLRDSVLIEIADRVVADKLAPDSEYGKDFPPVKITAVLRDGRVLSQVAEYSLGHVTERPLDFAGVERKFRSCVKSALAPPQDQAVDQFVDTIAHLELLEEFSVVPRLLGTTACS